MADVLERTVGRTKLWPGMLNGSNRTVEAELIEEVEGPAGSPENNKERGCCFALPEKFRRRYAGDMEVVFAKTLPRFWAACLRLRSP